MPTIRTIAKLTTNIAKMSTSAAKPKMNVHSFPRPPAIEQTPRHLEIKWNNQTIADTTKGYWVLETTHPPTYYLPRSCVNWDLVELNPIKGRSSLCEWKGRATYYDVTLKPENKTFRSKAWSYDTTTPDFDALQGHVSFYANDVPWDCFVDGERVAPQEGDFYGGWITSELEGPMKGGPGTWGW